MSTDNKGHLKLSAREPISYNTKDKIVFSCTKEYLSHNKKYHEIRLCQITLLNSSETNSKQCCSVMHM